MDPWIKRLILLLFALFVITMAACTSSGGEGEPADLDLAPLAEMPEPVRAAPVSVQQAYQFAAANPEVLEEIPCYCGCGAMGHTSNYACYFNNDDDGTQAFDPHALGCSICVDITHDTMRLLKQGKTLSEIRDYIDATYARYGPSNMP